MVMEIERVERPNYEEVIKGLSILVEEIREKCQRCRRQGIYLCGVCAMADYRASLRAILEVL